MSIDKEDINKYIFDPQNPTQCKSYNLLLRIAKKDNYTYLSPDYLKHFFANQIITKEFNDEIWDKPDNYSLLKTENKLKLFESLLSYEELTELVNRIDFNTDKLTKFSFFKNYFDIENYHINIDFENISNIEINKNILIKEESISRKSFCNSDIKENLIIFSRNEFDILESPVKKSSIFITLEENIVEFLKYTKNHNIKPIFLKKMEDVDLLLNVLEQDMQRSKHKDIIKEEIATIKSIDIKDFFSIKNLKLDNLEDKKEIYILGENGDGKTLLLQAIAIALKGVEKDGQERFREIKSQFDLTVVDSSNTPYQADENKSFQNMFAYGANRNNKSQQKDDEVGYLTLFDNSLDLKDPIKWLQFLDYSENKNENNVISVIQAKQLIQDILNKDVEIDIKPTGVTFKERGTELVEFDRLSAGYKGVITILCDLLVRLSTNQPYITDIKEYQGIVLIDEVELHLHPKWKYRFVKSLRDTFPLIQFIFTTHSPTVILGASKEAVFYKIYKENGEVCISDQIKNKGYTNNTLISSPLFDLDTFASENYPNEKLSDDDYVYEKIHEVVSQKIKNDINMDEDEILKLIDAELENL